MGRRPRERRVRAARAKGGRAPTFLPCAASLRQKHPFWSALRRVCLSSASPGATHRNLASFLGLPSHHPSLTISDERQKRPCRRPPRSRGSTPAKRPRPICCGGGHRERRPTCPRAVEAMMHCKLTVAQCPVFLHILFFFCGLVPQSHKHTHIYIQILEHRYTIRRLCV